ncbi:MAG: hypothetical protein JKY53_14780 [Flavobacteriales bacterium]|nr:hypothetical protein [Flavobacteriales bacterium]
MAIEHKDIPEVNLHEPKGISVATVGQVYTADGLGSGIHQLPQIKGQAAAVLDQLPYSDASGGTNWRSNRVVETRIIDSRSTALTQNPSAVDVPLQIEFGPAVSTTEVDLSVTGAITINVAGTYRLVFNGRFGRTTGVGIAELFFRLLIDAVQFSDSISHSLEDEEFALPYRNEIIGTFSAGTVLTAELLRDSAGINNGGLIQANPTPADWNNAPTAQVIVSKLFTG